MLTRWQLRCRARDGSARRCSSLRSRQLRPLRDHATRDCHSNRRGTCKKPTAAVPDAASAPVSAASGSEPSSSGRTSASSSGGGSSSIFADSPALLRRLVSTGSAAEAADLLLQQQPQLLSVSEPDALLLLSCALEAGNTALALSMYQDMCAARQRAGGAGAGGAAARWQAGSRGARAAAAAPPWPPATLAATTAVVLGLCRALRVADALAVMGSMRHQGVPRTEEVSFGLVVASPLPPYAPLAVVQPQEGAKLVADAGSRYEFELFSGTVTAMRSEALGGGGGNPLVAAARALRLLRTPPVGAVHEWVVTAPDGTARTFRAGSEASDVPAQVGERVTVVSAPRRGAPTKARRLLLTSSPPGSQPGEALAVTNHATRATLRLLRPPAGGADAALPGWVLPAAVMLASSDAASALVDPALPGLLAAGAAAAIGGAVAGNGVLLPALKRLPANAVKVEEMRQALLSQHDGLERKVAVTLQEGAEDVRTLARLWQLQTKMEAVGGGSRDGGDAPSGGGGGAYGARIDRIQAARAGLDERLERRLELLDGYARVMAMIEIEVEMELQVPAEEVAGIGEQIARLVELEELQGQWQAQAEAQDEVERLLRAAPAMPSFDRP